MWKNRVKTAVLLASMSGLLLFMGSLIAGKTGITIAFFISLLMNFVTYFFSDKIVLAMYKAQPLDKNKYPDIYAMVDGLAQQIGIPMPKLYLVDTPMANAFATGRNPNNASVAVTTGILNILEPRELRGVLAHELGHVQNRDILISTIAATLATAIGYLASMLRFSAYVQTSSSGEKRQTTNPFFVLVAAMLMPLAASLIQLALSRSREYLADETGAETSNDPLALASALKKLEQNIPAAHLRNDDVAHASTAPLFIVHPFFGKGLMTLFMTHPPTASRIERLQQIYNQMTHSPKG